MRISPLDILQQKFKIKIKGYDAEEVEAFLNLVAEDYKKANEEIANLKEEIDTQLKETEELIAREKVLKEAIISTKKITEQIQQNAENEASNVIKQSEMMSNTIIEQARVEVSKIKHEIEKLRIYRKQMYMKMESEMNLFINTLTDMRKIVEEEDKVSIISAADLPMKQQIK
jgi:cell division initiation protein